MGVNNYIDQISAMESALISRQIEHKIWVKHLSVINTPQTHLLDKQYILNKKKCNAFYTKHWCFKVKRVMYVMTHVFILKHVCLM